MAEPDCGLIVVKVGGSLFELPDFAARLHSWLRDLEQRRQGATAILVPGGGATTDVIRRLDQVHALGHEKAHWLALWALSLNAQFLAQLLPGIPIVSLVEEGAPQGIVDAFSFAVADEGKSGCLPHCWDTTSDSVAARVAVVTKASELILLKSTTIPPTMSWKEAGAAGYVDPVFHHVLQQAPRELRVAAVNFRTWCARPNEAAVRAHAPLRR